MRRKLYVWGAAVFFGGLLLGAFMGGKAGKFSTVPVAVVARRIPSGTILKRPEDWFVIKRYIAGTEPPESVRDVRHLCGRMALNDVQPGVLHGTDDFGQPLVKIPVPQGYRGVSIRTSPIPFVSAGSRVDVLCAWVDVDANDRRQKISKVILQNVLVLVADHDGQSAVVAALPEDAEPLCFASIHGHVTLLLRGSEDDAILNPAPQCLSR